MSTAISKEVLEKFACNPLLDYTITSQFGMRTITINGVTTTKKHNGLDFISRKLTIRSVLPGKVVANYWNKYRGWVVVVQHKKYKTLYQHMKEKCSLPVGTVVMTGTPLGEMGNTGIGTGGHLHCEVLVDNKPINYVNYLKGALKMDFEHALDVLVERGIIGNKDYWSIAGGVVIYLKPLVINAAEYIVAHCNK